MPLMPQSPGSISAPMTIAGFSPEKNTSSASKVSASSPASSNDIVTRSDGWRSSTVQFALPSSFMSLNIGLLNSVRFTASFGTCAWSMNVLGWLV